MKRIALGLVVAGLIANGFVFLVAAGLQDLGQKKPKLSSSLADLAQARQISLSEASRVALEQGPVED